MNNERRIVEPGPQAMEVLDCHYNDVIRMRNTSLQDIGSYPARWNEQAWRIALVFHAARYGNEAHTHQLEEKTAADAVTVQNWFAAQQLAILERKRNEAHQKLVEAVKNLCVRNPGGIKAKTVYRERITATSQEARALLGRLEDKGILEGEDHKPEGGGKVARVYRLKGI